jgi:hypothetical protein
MKFFSEPKKSIFDPENAKRAKSSYNRYPIYFVAVVQNIMLNHFKSMTNKKI